MFTAIKKIGMVLTGRQKSRIWLLFFIMVIGAGLEVVGVSLMVPLITAITMPEIIEKNGLIASVCGFFGITSHKSFILLCVITLIVVFIGKNLFLMFEYYAQARFVYNSRFYTQYRLMHLFLNRPYEFYLGVSTGDVLQLIQGDVQNVYALLMTLLSMTSELVVAFALVVTIFIVDWKMTVTVAVMLSLTIFLILKCIRPKLREAGREFHRNNRCLNKWLIQSVSGIKEIKTTQRGPFFEESFLNSGKRTISAEKKMMVMNNMPRLLIEMVSVVSMLSILAIQILCGSELEAMLPSLGAFAMAAIKLMPSANRVINGANALTYNMPAVDELIEHLKDPEVRDTFFGNAGKGTATVEAQRRFTSFTGQIELKDVTYAYPNTGRNVLEHVSMQIPIGKSVGVVGSSGAGKTTAVDILLGLLEPQSGAVLADGTDIREDYPHYLSCIGYIPQMIFMLDDTIRANVAFGISEDRISDEQVWKSLQEACLADFVRGLPNGLDTQIGERGLRISGGQRQRIGIARALYQNPDILFFDEATSSLDNETESAIMESIQALHGKKTMIIIAHRLQTIEGCDMVYRVSNGKITMEK